MKKSTTPPQADGVCKSFCSQTAALDCNLILSLQAAGNVPLLDETLALVQWVSRLVRKTLSFSKSLENHIGAIWYLIHHYNELLFA
jgi:hypothetical protein